MKLPCAVKKSLPKEVDLLVDEVARPKKFRLLPELACNPRQSVAPERSEGCLCFGRGARDISTRNARWRAQASTLADPRS